MIIRAYFDITKMRNMYRVEKNNKVLKNNFYSKKEAEAYVAELQKSNVIDIFTGKKVPAPLALNTIIVNPIAIFEGLRDSFLDVKLNKPVNRMFIRFLLVMWDKVKNQTTLHISKNAMDDLKEVVRIKNRKD